MERAIQGYLVAVDTNRQPGELIFEAAVVEGFRQYRLDERRSPPYVKSLVQVHPRVGRLTLLEGLHCDNLYYPDTFTVYVESVSDRLGKPEYYSMPIKVIVIGKNCDNNDVEQNNQLWMHHDRTVIDDEHDEGEWSSPSPFYSSHGSSKARLINARRWLCRQFESGHFGNSLLVGDKGYPIKRYYMRPLNTTTTPAEELYMYNVIERSYGAWKRRFPSLAMGLRVHLDTAQAINYCRNSSAT
ncbi:unnamed protein product [Acanthoscelides obtectus]|uniref:DDE Tnp4 domain-containing protein n=1 Tax=Acanthoscelides obtectus TaxID=200917 RepID=A0A9P0KKF9_ACAOB|nr:unnamed protein product [Acanthoscelides obtectus]CAK1655847.1 Protocadherin-like wing polarity protein stan [Acanthoscelides obtectus]